MVGRGQAPVGLSFAAVGEKLHITGQSLATTEKRGAATAVVIWVEVMAVMDTGVIVDERDKPIKRAPRFGDLVRPE
jgi:hypothetical protein